MQSKHRKKSTIFAANVPEIKNVQGGEATWHSYAQVEEVDGLTITYDM